MLGLRTSTVWTTLAALRQPPGRGAWRGSDLKWQLSRSKVDRLGPARVSAPTARPSGARPKGIVSVGNDGGAALRCLASVSVPAAGFVVFFFDDFRRPTSYKAAVTWDDEHGRGRPAFRSTSGTFLLCLAFHKTPPLHAI
jgi:hypothetical protein